MNAACPASTTPVGRVIDLAVKPSVAALLWVLVPMVVFATSLPVILYATPNRQAATGMVVVAFLGALLCMGLVLVVVGRSRRIEHRLVLDPRGVFLVSPTGAVEGLLGTPPLVLSPGHWLSASRSGTQWNQCISVGEHLSIGTYGVGSGPYRVGVPTMPRPRFLLRSADWAALVAWLPALRSIQ